MDTIVTVAQAKQLQELGYNGTCEHYYTFDKKGNPILRKYKNRLVVADKRIPAPTIQQFNYFVWRNL